MLHHTGTLAEAGSGRAPNAPATMPPTAPANALSAPRRLVLLATALVNWSTVFKGTVSSPWN